MYCLSRLDSVKISGNKLSLLKPSFKDKGNY